MICHVLVVLIFSKRLSDDASAVRFLNPLSGMICFLYFWCCDKARPRQLQYRKGMGLGNVLAEHKCSANPNYEPYGIFRLLHHWYLILATAIAVIIYLGESAEVHVTFQPSRFNFCARDIKVRSPLSLSVYLTFKHGTLLPCEHTSLS